MKEQFVPYEIALKLKEKGFNQQCLAYYNTDPYLKIPVFNLTKPFEHEWVLPTPLWKQVLDWLSEKYEIDISTPPFWDVDGRLYSTILYRKSDGSLQSDEENTFQFLSELPTRRAALERGVTEALTLI